METRRGSKVRIVLLAVVIVAAAAMVAVGAMAATGVFESDKVAAFRLLAQVPDNINRSYIKDHLETEKLKTACQENGVSADIRMSGLKLSKELREELAGGTDLSPFGLQMDTQADPSGKQSNVYLGLSKGDEKITAVVYTDEDKQCIAFPELSQGKYIRMDHNASGDAAGQDEEDLTKALTEYRNTRKYEEFVRALGKFLTEEIEKVYDDIICEEKGKESYELTIPRDTLNAVVTDLYEFMAGQKDTIHIINLYTGTDVLDGLKEFSDYFTANSSDFVFHVAGKDGTLSQIRAEAEIGGEPFTLEANFQGKEDSKAEITVKTEQDGEEVRLELVLRDTKSDVCQESAELHLLFGGVSYATVNYETKIDPGSNQYDARLSCKVVEEELVRLEMQGKIKNLNPGRSLSYALDKVSLRVSGEELFSAAMNITLGTLEGKIEPPKGEELALDADMAFEDEEKSEAFISELTDNLMNRLVEWGLMNPSDVLLAPLS